MSQEVPVRTAPDQASQEVPLIVKYHQELASLKQQREQVRVQLEQLTGAVFACEHLIRLYEENLQQGAAKFAKDAANSLKPNENLGEINDGQAKSESKEQVAQK